MGTAWIDMAGSRVARTPHQLRFEQIANESVGKHGIAV